MTLVSKIYNSDMRRVLAWSRKGKTKKECEKIMTVNHYKKNHSKPYDPGYTQEEIIARIAKHKKES